MPKLTKRLIDGLAASGDRLIIWDSEIKGFGLLALPTGVRSFIIQYRNESGRQRRLTLGRYGVITADEARKAARDTLASVSKGADPVGQRQAQRSAPLVSNMLDRYLSDHVDVHNSARMAESARLSIEKHILPRLGSLRVVSVTRQDVLKLHRAMEATPRQANLTLAVLSKAFSLAELWGLRPDESNPCRKVPRYPESARERFLSNEELSRLGAVLRAAESPGLPWAERDGAKAKHLAKAENRVTPISPRALAAIRLLLFTGARLSEILELKWEHVDFEAGAIALPNRKGGVRRAHPVSSIALTVLADLPREEGAPWVLPAPLDAKKSLSKSVVENAWQRIRSCAGVPDVRLHDLRHTVGTFASQAGVNAFHVRDLLRHSNIAVTARYANRDSDPIRAVSEDVGARIKAGLENKPAGEIVGFSRKPKTG
ncbi:tyrosine-type recombinase/integrase [Methylocystis parvus]|uniref:Site-specific integrase n=1 Tax=Methylocystis parvus TaxID=134 RepID=A0A6B8M4H4_9HYPH|nr:site-specific integrase [Methylocystis parvus]QGM97791.1 site-specific integrase [Methylocystis parvus]WBK01903.1 site-specific integrase [Methylocystis parvus OBBP]